MFRFSISMVWGAMSAAIVFAANDALFANLVAFAVLASLLGFSLWGADTLRLRDPERISSKPLRVRLGIWFLRYELIPGALVWLLALCFGLFALPHGPGTALAMCLPISLITLRDYADLSWLER